MPEPELGSVKKLAVREVWPHEAKDFTPWLAQNLSKLGEALDMDLELQGHGLPVGPFALDVLAKDRRRDRLVVIENQLERTDHDHLGKLLTYAAGCGACALVWIAVEIRDEHRQALDWLNQNTSGKLEFFGVVVEAVQDASRTVCKFKLVPPGERRKPAIDADGGAPSERGEAYLAFFQDLVDELRDKHNITDAGAAKPTSYYHFASKGGCRNTLAFGRNDFKAWVIIDRGEASMNKALFEALRSERDAIHKEFGADLGWEQSADGGRAYNIMICRPGSITSDMQTLQEIRTWGIEHLLKMKKVVWPRLSALLTATPATSG